MDKVWDNITGKVESAAKTVGKEAAKIADTAKTKYNIAVKEGKLEKIYESIGALHYDQLKNENDNSEKIAELVAEADAINAELDELRSEPEAKQTKDDKCAECGAKLPKDAAFCPKCGAGIE